MDVAFLPADAAWNGVSPRLSRLRHFLLLLVGVPLVLGAVVVLVLLSVPWAAVLAFLAGVALVVWGWFVVGRQQRSWKYAVRAEDLLVSHGVMFRKLVVVPYGRMQFVDVAAGPLERRFGIATVQLHTAAAATDARIPGVLPEDAARLREHLSALGEARSAGL